MVRLAAWLVNDVALAEEIVQDAFVRLATTTSDLSTLDSDSAYLRTIVVNLTRTKIRRLAIARRHRPDPAGSSPAADAMLIDEDLASAVASLPRRQRECVVLRYTVDLAVKEIAETLGISPGSVKSHLHRALATLSRLVEPSEPSEPSESIMTQEAP